MPFAFIQANHTVPPTSSQPTARLQVEAVADLLFYTSTNNGIIFVWLTQFRYTQFQAKPTNLQRQCRQRQTPARLYLSNMCCYLAVLRAYIIWFCFLTQFNLIQLQFVLFQAKPTDSPSAALHQYQWNHPCPLLPVNLLLLQSNLLPLNLLLHPSRV